MPTSAGRRAGGRDRDPTWAAENLKKPAENHTFRPFWPSRRPGNAPGLPRSSGRPAQGRSRAPRACPGARQDCPRPAQGRPRAAEELRKACLGPRQGAQGLPGSSPDLARPAQGRHGPAEELRKACPRPPMACSVRLDSSSLPQDGCSKSQLHSATSDNAEKASEHARVHSRRPSPMFRPVAASRSGTRY